MKSVTAKLGNMRKAQEWVVYPWKSESDPVTVQSDQYIGQFDPYTGKGRLSARRPGGAYFVHLATAKPFQFPAEFVREATAAIACSGDKIGPGVYIA